MIFDAEVNVVGSCPRRNEREFLSNDGDTSRKCFAGRADCDGLPRELNFPGIELVDTGKYFSKRRLTSSVLSNKRVNAARSDLEVDAIQGNSRAKALIYPTNLKIHFGIIPFFEQVLFNKY